MAKFAIVGDSTCDLTPELRNKYDIDYCKMSVSWTGKDGSDHEILASLEWEEISHKDYFDILASGVRIFTSQVVEQEVERVFRKHLSAGEDVIYIACSGRLSASVRFVENLINQKYSKEFPDRKIYAVDPFISCMGQGAILIKASELRAEGKSIDEVKDWIETHRNEFHQLATVENLDTLKRAGRVKASQAFFGNIFGVKPILISDAIGNNYAIERQKGRRNALLRMVELAKENVIDPENQIAYISDAESKPEDVELLVSNLKSAIPFKDIIVVPMGPIIGASTGKGTLALYFVGKEVTVVGE